MADAAIMLPPKGAASFTTDPANSGTAAFSMLARKYIEGPPIDGSAFGLSRWIIQAAGTQTTSNSLTAAQYRWLEDVPSGVAAPTSFNYVATL